jgi:hypothetical protein
MLRDGRKWDQTKNNVQSTEIATSFRQKADLFAMTVPLSPCLSSTPEATNKKSFEPANSVGSSEDENHGRCPSDRFAIKKIRKLQNEENRHTGTCAAHRGEFHDEEASGGDARRHGEKNSVSQRRLTANY